MISQGLITGNTYIMKPSERDPTACMALVRNNFLSTFSNV